ncbi:MULTISPECIES: hypothetical protein [unclassified Roseofilum]|uniref:hypothetical protein n=1 Tax=unclassified Roseofilum TaxID=2620099 RepID=UPI000E8884C8|nr:MULTISPECIES: hypothetical protein [unclassified Roseofilum]HBQ99344.1 hypothetical protein [Cyanobacteria bacterium UBA11691]MBP0008521.1 hypothetical protein [Roseofilum sp. Belize Diploria]MBP0012371.1 hypothetical protein [Roseofilum sp. SID3]MBP0026619.1 hypothetical protein [Roseofilum sp. SID2]MBP0035718.1 hypothetical protein [Roseofilum sp. Belize BBD 4]
MLPIPKPAWFLTLGSLTLSSLTFNPSASAQTLGFSCRDNQICPVFNILLQTTEVFTRTCPPTSDNPQDYANYLGQWIDRIPQIQAQVNALNRNNSYTPTLPSSPNQVVNFLNTWVDIARIAQTQANRIEQTLDNCPSRLPVLPDGSTLPSISMETEFPKVCQFDPNTLTWKC